ncbi:hypothetical protein [Methanosarcina sp. 1.H.A.2.2]|uniref:hypothetical protein n=1 Tax=Methanosarcina sp. 1.H.A.2.2 TaxID=1483601 RepID=UPI00062279A2|nr:hypothetical protein [Methanosarcina sp. 1.H.A.2.2]KKH50381.1 hypothetical protein EO93_10025 [Methanosarcina sp. 1.H.A.2.2]
MGKKTETIGKGLSLYGSLKNRQEHNELNAKINLLNNKQQSIRFGLINLGRSVQNNSLKHANLNNDMVQNFKTLFHYFEINRNRLNKYAKIIKEQKQEIERLKLKIQEIETEINNRG